MQDPSFYSQINNNNNQTQPQFPENEHLKCPRCDSTNTKFCYYNNYNLSQPRHFCKNCKRYWTKGGALRNIPVGGGTRKRSAGDTAGVATKRPAPSVVPEKESSDEKGKNGETLALIGGDHFEGQFGNFSSLLEEGQFGNFSEPGQGQGQVDSQVDNGDGFLNIESVVSGGDNNTWPDLSIYTPGSTFQ